MIGNSARYHILIEAHQKNVTQLPHLFMYQHDQVWYCMTPQLPLTLEGFSSALMLLRSGKGIEPDESIGLADITVI